MPAEQSDQGPSQRAELVRQAAEAGRLPSIVAATFTHGVLDWQFGLGPAAAQYRIGSITKTFTAVMVMRLRDQGRVDLRDPLGKHVPDAPYGDHTLRGLLAHNCGMTAEPTGPWWERSAGVSWERLAADNREPRLVFRPGERYHYSNLGYGLLGELVARLSGMSWFEAVRAALLEPLGLTSTTYDRLEGAAPGTSRDPRNGRLMAEPATRTGAMAAAGQLWSTATDLARWGELLAGGDAALVRPASLVEMLTAQSADPDTQHVGAYGLGTRLRWHPKGTLVGHTGSMPGFLAALLVDPASHRGGLVLTNATTGLDPEALVVRLIDAAGEPAPAPTLNARLDRSSLRPESVALEGPWYWGNTPMRLEATARGFDLVTDSSRRTFTLVGSDQFVGEDGYFAGERLDVVRRPDTTVSQLEVVGFVLTRQPYDPAAPIPGGPPTQLA